MFGRKRRARERAVWADLRIRADFGDNFSRYGAEHAALIGIGQMVGLGYPASVIRGRIETWLDGCIPPDVKGWLDSLEDDE